MEVVFAYRWWRSTLFCIDRNTKGFAIHLKTSCQHKPDECGCICCFQVEECVTEGNKLGQGKLEGPQRFVRVVQSHFHTKGPICRSRSTKGPSSQVGLRPPSASSVPGSHFKYLCSRRVVRAFCSTALFSVTTKIRYSLSKFQRTKTSASSNAGMSNPQPSSCFLVCTKDDSIEGTYTLKQAMIVERAKRGKKGSNNLSFCIR